jgi:hypothetical protein
MVADLCSTVGSSVPPKGKAIENCFCRWNPFWPADSLVFVQLPKVLSQQAGLARKKGKGGSRTLRSLNPKPYARGP